MLQRLVPAMRQGYKGFHYTPASTQQKAIKRLALAVPSGADVRFPSARKSARRKLPEESGLPTFRTTDDELSTREFAGEGRVESLIPEPSP